MTLAPRPKKRIFRPFRDSRDSTGSLNQPEVSGPMPEAIDRGQAELV